jgi:hypothetical protein
MRDQRACAFEHRHYVRDRCIVRAQMCPESNQCIAVFWRLLADERGARSFEKLITIFPPHVDGPERETAPAIWRLRSATISDDQRRSATINYGRRRT